MKHVESAINAVLIEREEQVRLMIIGLLSRQHVLFVGPPGTAKSMMGERLISSVGAHGFNQLMHKHLPPDELVGPVDLLKMKQGQYERVLTNMLPEAEIAMLDEIWKSSPAILNTLLRFLNERKFLNGTAGMVKTPLHFAMAFSNEWPIGEGYETLGALFDRFLIRSTIHAVSKSAWKQLVFGKNIGNDVLQHATMSEVKDEQDKVDNVVWTDAMIDKWYEIADEVHSEGIVFGPRRLRLSRSVIQAAAHMEGRDHVVQTDLEVMKHILWVAPDQEQKTAEIVCRLANPTGWKITEILTAADEAIDEITDFTSPEAFAAARKVKDLRDELEQLKGTGNGRAVKAVEYLKGRMTALNMKLIGQS